MLPLYEPSHRVRRCPADSEHGPTRLRVLGRPARDIRAPRPVLILVGSDDPLGGPRSIEKLADSYRHRSGLSDVTAIVYEGARHEIFNEPLQGQVRDDLLEWLDERIAVRD